MLALPPGNDSYLALEVRGTPSAMPLASFATAEGVVGARLHREADGAVVLRRADGDPVLSLPAPVARGDEPLLMGLRLGPATSGLRTNDTLRESPISVFPDASSPLVLAGEDADRFRVMGRGTGRALRWGGAPLPTPPAHGPARPDRDGLASSARGHPVVRDDDGRATDRAGRVPPRLPVVRVWRSGGAVDGFRAPVLFGRRTGHRGPPDAAALRGAVARRGQPGVLRRRVRARSAGPRRPLQPDGRDRRAVALRRRRLQARGRPAADPRRAAWRGRRVLCPAPRARAPAGRAPVQLPRGVHARGAQECPAPRARVPRGIPRARGRGAVPAASPRVPHEPQQRGARLHRVGAQPRARQRAGAPVDRLREPRPAARPLRERQRLRPSRATRASGSRCWKRWRAARR